MDSFWGGRGDETRLEFQIEGSPQIGKRFRGVGLPLIHGLILKHKDNRMSYNWFVTKKKQIWIGFNILNIIWFLKLLEDYTSSVENFS